LTEALMRGDPIPRDNFAQRRQRGRPRIGGSGFARIPQSLTRNVAADLNKVSSPPRKRGPRACPWQEQGATGRTLAAPGFPLSRE
jgi:hypothetical protein